MKRREFMALVGGAAMAWPLAARAQQGGRVRRIGWLSPGSGPNDATRSFLQGAREHGYLEGENFLVEYRWAAGKSARLAQLADELVHAGVDLIVTVGTHRRHWPPNKRRRRYRSYLRPPAHRFRKGSLPAWRTPAAT